MNKATLSKLSKMYGKIDDLKEILSEINDTQNESFEKLSEKRQESEAGEIFRNRLEHLEQTITYLQDALDELDNATADYED